MTPPQMILRPHLPFRRLRHRYPYHLCPYHLCPYLPNLRRR